METHRGFTITTVIEEDGTWTAIIHREDRAPITFEGSTMPDFRTERFPTSQGATSFARDVIGTGQLR
jgi:hypothetical protein